MIDRGTQYDRIVEHLHRPRVVVHDPCAPPLADEDREWPAPVDRRDIMGIFVQLAPVLRARCGLVIAESVLADFERAHPDDMRPRKAIEVVIRWLGGETMLGGEIATAGGAARAARADDDATWRGASIAADLAAALLGGFCGDGLDYAIDAAVSVTGHQHRRAWLAWWWARCRALLPLANPLTYDIEWTGLDACFPKAIT